MADEHGNVIAREGCDRCVCGCKYWENDRCVDCGASPIRYRIVRQVDSTGTRWFVSHGDQAYTRNPAKASLWDDLERAEKHAETDRMLERRSPRGVTIFVEEVAS